MMIPIARRSEVFEKTHELVLSTSTNTGVLQRMRGSKLQRIIASRGAIDD